jgi:hypothetical protein
MSSCRSASLTTSNCRGRAQAVAQPLQPLGEGGQRVGIVQGIVQRLEGLQAVQAIPAMVQRRHRTQPGAGGGERQRMAVVGDRFLALGAHLRDQFPQARQFVEAGGGQRFPQQIG